MSVVRSMLLALQKTGNRIAFDKHAHDLIFKLGLSFKSIQDEWRRILDEPSNPTTDKQEESSQEISSKPSAQEFWLLKLLLLHENLAGWAALHLDMNWIQNSLARQIVALRLAAQRNESWQNLAVFSNECETPELRNLVTEVGAEERAIPNPEQQLHDVVKFFRNQFFDRQIAAMLQRMSQSQMSDVERVELLREQQKLREQKRAPLSPLN